MDSYDIADNYDHLNDDIVYILENVLSEEVKKNASENVECRKLQDIFNSFLLNKCECKEQEEPHKCRNCFHGANYKFNDKFQEFVLNPFRKMPDLIYECTHMCLCNPKKCQNRLVQYGPRKFLKIVDSPKYGSKGLMTLRDIPRGAFICEYAGELLTRQEAMTILRKNEIEKKMNYVLFLKESSLLNPSDKNTDCDMLLTIVNPCKKGNIGRYLNHSCDPNCQIVSVRIDCPIPKIAIFSKCFIKAGEELCFNYNEGVVNSKDLNMSTSKRIPCLCGSVNCLKFLPNSECF